MKRRITAVLVDTAKDTYGVVNIPDELDVFYKLLSCDCIDITVRRIGLRGQKAYEIICDDEGLFKDPQKISAIDSSGQAQLVGSILITGPADSEGNLTSLTVPDINYIFSKIQLLATINFKDPYPILTECEYA